VVVVAGRSGRLGAMLVQCVKNGHDGGSVMRRAADQHLVKPDDEAIDRDERHGQNRHHDDGQKNETTRLFGLAKFFGFGHDIASNEMGMTNDSRRGLSGNPSYAP
jgi:hypothetical protein